MKKRVLAIVTGLLLAAGTLFAQTLTDVINEFNAGVESLNGQSYETALEQFNNCLALCDKVGDEAADMKRKTQEQIVGANFRQATTLLKRKQYDQAIPYLENTIKYANEYQVNQDYAAKSEQYLPALYLREGNVLLKQKEYDKALETFDKVLSMRPDIYKAHQGKGLVYDEMGKKDKMLEEFAIAKEKAEAQNDQEVINDINSAINLYYKKLIDDEYTMIDPDEGDYTYLLDLCDEAIAANDKNSYAYWYAAMAKNKMVEYDDAIAYANKALAYETDPNLLSALYFELGYAYQNTVRYKEACEAYHKVTEEPFFSKAEKKMMNVPDCN